MAANAKVSSTTIGRALRILSQQDLILVTRGKVSPREVSYEELREAVAIRVVLDCLCATELHSRSKHLPKSRMDQLTEVHNELELLIVEPGVDPIRVIDCDWMFHRTIAELARFTLLIPLLRKLHHRILINAPSILDQKRWASLAEDHRMILQQIIWGKSDAQLCGAIKAHLLNGVRTFYPDTYERFLENDVPDVFAMPSNGRSPGH